MRLPRGIRNNNPLNIRIGNKWLGERETKTDPYFEEFKEMKYGIRAAVIILRRYIKFYHRDTIRKIIASWAPETENLTSIYISTVSNRMAYPADDIINYDNAKQICDLIEAMAFVECGQGIDYKVIQDGYHLVDPAAFL